ncbi:hypothetical protein FLJC2902T_32040 [Flavobacterium limnosediminis JC2902]|uniref:Uncharacterized protein n=2 Tax=Flavobacterium TaxID=237 RepID=V6SBJ3_9FLAO|nr:hypothetical protein FLJC2902T_32040 [Flavobacterium limnosediminis JC2902]
MKNSEIENILIKKCELLNLKNRAFTMFDNIFAQNSENEIAEIFNGVNKEQLTINFKNYSFTIIENKTSIKTRLDLFQNLDKKIGYYEIETDLEGEFLDEYLKLY